MDAPANTLSYMIAGYAVIFSVNIIYLASLIIRWRNLKQDKEMLEQVDADKNYDPETSRANVKTV